MEITTCNRYILEHLEPYAVTPDAPPDMVVDIGPAQSISMPAGTRVFNEMISWICKIPEGNGYFGYCATGRNRVFASIDGDAEWKNAKIRYIDGMFADKNEDVRRQLEYFYIHIAGAALANRIILKNGLVLHASCISYNGKGIAFTAPSGTGKSTHTGLWEKYKPGTVILNDDAPVIRILEGNPTVYGTPWSGSRFKNHNASAPLTAIVIMERAKENSIKRISPSEAIKGLMPRVLLPYFDPRLVDIALATLDDVIRMVSVYHLRCRPDAQAMELVYQCVM